MESRATMMTGPVADRAMRSPLDKHDIRVIGNVIQIGKHVSLTCRSEGDAKEFIKHLTVDRKQNRIRLEIEKHDTTD